MIKRYTQLELNLATKSTTNNRFQLGKNIRWLTYNVSSSNAVSIVPRAVQFFFHFHPKKLKWIWKAEVSKIWHMCDMKVPLIDSAGNVQKKIVSPPSLSIFWLSREIRLSSKYRWMTRPETAYNSEHKRSRDAPFSWEECCSQLEVVESFMWTTRQDW